MSKILANKESLVAHAKQKDRKMNKIEDVKLTPHFSLYEFCKTSHKDLQQKNLEYGKSIQTRLETQADFLEKVRTLLGCPLLITSGVRCPELNTRVGGSKTSQHCSGHATDIIPQGKHTVQDYFCMIYESNLIYDQLILEESGGKIWIHLSYIGMNGRRQALYYNGKKYVVYNGKQTKG